MLPKNMLKQYKIIYPWAYIENFMLQGNDTKVGGLERGRGKDSGRGAEPTFYMRLRRDLKVERGLGGGSGGKYVCP